MTNQEIFDAGLDRLHGAAHFMGAFGHQATRAAKARILAELDAGTLLSVSGPMDMATWFFERPLAVTDAQKIESVSFELQGVIRREIIPAFAATLTREQANALVSAIYTIRTATGSPSIEIAHGVRMDERQLAQAWADVNPDQEPITLFC